MQAMILAAGFGTRLLPFSKVRPKPLFPIINRPLLQLTVTRLQRAGFDRIVVNCHYLRRQIIEELDQIPGVIIQEEDMVLGTGGGMRLALRSFRDEPVLFTCGDIYHDVDFRHLYESHQPDMAPVTMAMHDFSRFNKVVVEGDFVKSFDGRGPATLVAFTGLQVVNPEILEPIPLQKAASIIDFYRQQLLAKVSIRSVRVDGSYWTDMGTLKDYLGLHGGLLTRQIPWWPELGSRPENPFFLAAGNRVADTVAMEDWVCAGRVDLGRDIRLARTVLWDGASVPDGSRLHDVLVTE